MVRYKLEVLFTPFFLDFNCTPSPYFERNNFSARNNLSFVRQEVDKLLAKNAIVKLDYQPFVVSPLTVASRVCCLTNEVKLR